MLRGVLAVAALCAAGAASAGMRPALEAPPTLTLDACSWDRPGINPFMGDVVGAVDRYQDIPPEVRARLKARMAKREYDDIVSIKRDSIDGQAGQEYSNVISDMHFGTHQVCRSVTRASWTTAMQERGLVYCESGRCILVPTVCRNVSRVSRKGVSPEHAEAPDDAAGPIAEVPALPADPTRALALDAAPSFAEPLAHLREAGPIGAVPGVFGSAFDGGPLAAGGAVPPLVSGPIGGFPGGVPAAASAPPE
ncbi:MAG TPA: MHFG family PEP-CTERM protein, partial [Burkholderiaceae bacterium]|nr:MHFG family PEP-CTERM protein [Burkholderiaceae bacterium]